MTGARSGVELYERIQEATRAIRAASQPACPDSPRVGIILGTGLGGLAGEIEAAARIPYARIPHFPHPRVESHSGHLLLGRLGGQTVAAMEGRCHLYEGYSLEEITLPVRVLKALGVETLIISNAAGGLDPHLDKGDIILIDDHINLMGVNPLVGPNDERLGPRFPDMCRPYDPELIRLAEAIALEEGIRARRGVYAALTGPCLETRAEYRMLRILGADAVGMSTVPEVIVGVHAGLKILGISCITDLCLPDALEPVRIEDILAVAGKAEPKITRLVRRLIERAPPASAGGAAAAALGSR
jgi:purine-nucleoside phosphorylase